jgi:hypothetical protein
MAVERDERSSVAQEFIYYGRGAGRTLIGSKGVYVVYGRCARRTLIGSTGVYMARSFQGQVTRMKVSNFATFFDVCM